MRSDLALHGRGRGYQRGHLSCETQRSLLALPHLSRSSPRPVSARLRQRKGEGERWREQQQQRSRGFMDERRWAGQAVDAPAQVLLKRRMGREEDCIHGAFVPSSYQVTLVSAQRCPTGEWTRVYREPAAAHCVSAPPGWPRFTAQCHSSPRYNVQAATLARKLARRASHDNPDRIE